MDTDWLAVTTSEEPQTIIKSQNSWFVGREWSLVGGGGIKAIDICTFPMLIFIVLWMVVVVFWSRPKNNVVRHGNSRWADNDLWSHIPAFFSPVLDHEPCHLRGCRWTMANRQY